MTDYERGLRDGKIETFRDAQETSWVQYCQRGNEPSANRLSGIFMRQADELEAAKSNPQPPRQGGDGGGVDG